MNMFGSFLPSLGRQATTVYSGRGSRHCYEIKTQVSTTNLGHPPSLYTFSSNLVAILPPRSSWPQSWTCQARATLYEGVGSVKRHLESTSFTTRFFLT